MKISAYKNFSLYYTQNARGCLKQTTKREEKVKEKEKRKRGLKLKQNGQLVLERKFLGALCL